MKAGKKVRLNKAYDAVCEEKLLHRLTHKKGIDPAQEEILKDVLLDRLRWSARMYGAKKYSKANLGELLETCGPYQMGIFESDGLAVMVVVQKT